MEFTTTEIPAQTMGAETGEPVTKREFSVGAPERAAPATDPKALAPSASSPGGNEAGKAETAPGTAAPAAGEKPPEKADGKAFAALKRERQRVEAVVAQAKPLIEAKEAWDKGDVDTVLDRLGIQGDKLVDLWVKRQGGTTAEGTEGEPAKAAPETDALTKRLEELESRIKAKDQEAAATQALQAHLGKLSEALKGDSARWEMCTKDPKAPQIAFDVMFEHNRRTGEYLSYEQALDAVEDFKINEAIVSAMPDRAARRALLGAKTQSGEQPAASPAATGGNEVEMTAQDRLRQAMGLKPRVTVNNSAASAAPTTATPRTRGVDADKRFFDKVRALRGSA